MYLLELSNTQPVTACTHTIMYWYSSGLFCHSMVSFDLKIITVVLVTVSLRCVFLLFNTLVEEKLQRGPEVCCTWNLVLFWLRILVDHLPSTLVDLPVFWVHYTDLLFPNLFYHSQCPRGRSCLCLHYPVLMFTTAATPRFTLNDFNVDTTPRFTF